MRTHPLQQRGSGARGFTLIELVFTIVIVAVMLVIAIPNFNRMINAHRLTTAANDVITELNEARMEAIKINSYTQFCGNSQTTNGSDGLGTACGTELGAVYEQINSSGTLSYPMVLKESTDIDNSAIRVTTSNAIRYSGLGLGYTPGTSAPYSGTVADICSTGLSTNNHIQVLIAGGSVLSTNGPFTGTCP